MPRTSGWNSARIRLLAPQTDYELVLSQGIRDLNGLALDSAISVPFTTGTIPYPPTNLVFASVSVGYVFACGVTTAGAAYCWGDNFTGALGDWCIYNGALTPVPVAGGAHLRERERQFLPHVRSHHEWYRYCWGAGGSAILSVRVPPPYPSPATPHVRERERRVRPQLRA